MTRLPFLPQPTASQEERPAKRKRESTDIESISSTASTVPDLSSEDQATCSNPVHPHPTTSGSSFIPGFPRVPTSHIKRPPSWSPEGCLKLYNKVKNRYLDPDRPVTWCNALKETGTNSSTFEQKRHLAELMILDYTTFTEMKRRMDREQMELTNGAYWASLSSLSYECQRILSRPDMKTKRQRALQEKRVFGKYCGLYY
jgi:hypothetical protein